MGEIGIAQALASLGKIVLAFLDSFSLHWTFGRDSGETSVKEHRRAPKGRRRYAAFWRKVVIWVGRIFALDMRRRIPMR
jgi:hypothetical protein